MAKTKIVCETCKYKFEMNSTDLALSDKYSELFHDILMIHAISDHQVMVIDCNEESLPSGGLHYTGSFIG